jgi:hypothetical protein
VIEPITRQSSQQPIKQSSPHRPHSPSPKSFNTEVDEAVLHTKWALPPRPKTPRLRFRGDDSLEWPPGPRAGRRKVPCRPASASEAVDYAEAIRARAALDIVVGRLRDAIRESWDGIVAVWRDKYDEFEARVNHAVEMLVKAQADEVKRELNDVKHKIIPQNTNRISRKVLDLMSLAASHAVAAGRSSRLSMSLEKQADYEGGLLVTRNNYANVVYHDGKRRVLEKKVREANCHVDKSKVSEESSFYSTF